MAATNSTVAAAEVGVWAVAASAATVDSVTFGRDCEWVRVWNDTGTAAIWFTTDGTTPVAGAKACYRVVPSAYQYTEVNVVGGGNTVVKLISSGTPTYSVEGSL